MNQRLNVSTEVLLSYIRNSNIPIEIIRNKIHKIDSILSGELGPTFNQLVLLSKLINVSTGLLMLKKTITPNPLKVDFRTLDSQVLSEMSSELKDTILEMQEKQDFLREVIEQDCSFVGMFDWNDNKEDIIEKVKSLLGEEITHNRFEYYRKVIGELGVFIFLNGKFKDNTHRPLNLKEFRGFVLADKKAPIIFINQLDSKAGHLFTLIHEFVHLLFGDSDLLETNEMINRIKTEAVINSITAEILVPKSLLSEMYSYQMSIEDNLEAIAKRCEVSKFVILRRLYDLSMISKKQYESLKSQLNDEFNKFSNLKTSSNGGNYNINLQYRIDHNFFRHVNNAVVQNKISYTEAFSIVGVGYKGYKKLSEGLV